MVTPEERRLIASLAAHTQWANCTDRTARTAKARQAAEDRFERQVDPDGVLDPDERLRRAESARKAYFAKLALQGLKARRKRKEARERESQLLAGIQATESAEGEVA